MDPPFLFHSVFLTGADVVLHHLSSRPIRGRAGLTCVSEETEGSGNKECVSVCVCVRARACTEDCEVTEKKQGA